MVGVFGCAQWSFGPWTIFQVGLVRCLEPSKKYNRSLKQVRWFPHHNIIKDIKIYYKGYKDIIKDV